MDCQTSKITIKIQSEVSETAPGFLTATKCYDEQRGFLNVLAKKFPCDMQEYFAWRKSLTHTNIHKVDAIVPDEGSNGCIISYEQVDGNLDSILRAARKLSGHRHPFIKSLVGNYDGFIIHIISQIRSALEELHLENKYHGKLNCESILFSYNDRYPQGDVRHIDIKLSMPEHEAQEANVGSILDDQLSLGLVLEELDAAFPSIRSIEFGALCQRLMSDEILNHDDIFNHYSMWSDSRKSDFLCFMKFKISKYHYAEEFEVKQWRRHFKEELDISEKHLLSLNPLGHIPKYFDTFGSFIYFNRNTLSHFHEYAAHDQRKFGPDLKHVLRRFLEFYPAIFVDLVPEITDEEVWKSFFNESK